jgi:hypothetical protein
MNVSLHVTGLYRLAFTDQHPADPAMDRAFLKWKRAPNLAPALTRALSLGGVVDPAFAAIARLAELHETHLSDLVGCLAGLIDVSTDPWLVAASTEEIRTIMRAGLRAGSPAVGQVARAATNRFVARGHSEFADLLR